MYTNIENNIESIIVNNKDSIEKHFYLYKELLENKSCLYRSINELDESYTKKYKYFWAMYSARLNETFYEKYFSLSNSDSVKNIFNTLKDANMNMQYSFSSKLYHTFKDQSSPIYDSKIKLFYLLPDPNNFEKFETQMRFLEREYDRILTHGLLNKSITLLKNNFEIAKDVSNEKLIDSILWVYVNAMQKRDLKNNDAMLYS